MSEACQTCYNEYDVCECGECGVELCESCHHMTIDYTWVCPACKEPYEEKYRDRYSEMHSLLGFVYTNNKHESDMPDDFIARIKKVLGYI